MWYVYLARVQLLIIYQGVKLRLIQAPMRLNFSLWRLNPVKKSPKEKNWFYTLKYACQYIQEHYPVLYNHRVTKPIKHLSILNLGRWYYGAVCGVIWLFLTIVEYVFQWIQEHHPVLYNHGITKPIKHLYIINLGRWYYGAVCGAIWLFLTWVEYVFQ